MTSPFQQHVEKWKSGCGSCLCEKAKQVVFARGSIPCDILFIGEAPGDSENIIGQPFVGPAGKLLDQIIARALVNGPNKSSPTWCMTNLVGCFPKEEKESGNHEPPKEAIKACAPRLKEFVEICQTKLIVCVGALATKWVPEATAKIEVRTKPVKWCNIIHPAAILRANLAQQGFAIQKCVVALSTAIGEL